MNVQDKVIIVTGAASGIGLAMSQRFLQEGARHVYLSDINAEQLTAVVSSLKTDTSSQNTNTSLLEPRASAIVCDVSNEAQIQAMVDQVITEQGQIDLFCSNAGILSVDNPLTATDQYWQRALNINLMAHVYAARAALPHMLEQGSGYFLNTASAAGLLNQPSTTTYAVSKHAAIGFAESLKIEFGDQGINVSVLCPQAVNTPMVTQGDVKDFKDAGVAGLDGILEPEALCDAVIEGLSKEQFVILPHPQVQQYMQGKVADYDRWLSEMIRLKAYQATC